MRGILTIPMRSFAAVLAVTTAALVATFWDFAIKPNPRDLLGGGDCWLHNGPYAYFTDYAIHQGELPLWNPLTECGKPHAANPQVALFYPPNLLRSLLTFHPTPMKTHIGLALLMAAHLIMAGAATFYFARDHGLGAGAAWVVAFAFVFSANFIARAPAHWPFVALMAWLPVMLLLLHWLLRAPSFSHKVFYALSGGLLFGFNILIGFPQLTIYLGLTLGAYTVLYHVLNRPAEAGAQSLSRNGLIKDLPLLGLWFAVSIPVAMAMLWPAQELAGLTVRTKAAQVSFEFDVQKRQSVRELLECLITFPGGAEVEGLHFIGAGALLLALAGLTHAKRRDAALFGMLFLILLDCSLGPPFPVAGVVQWLAPFRMFTPERASLFACFPLAMLAGYGVDATARQLGGPRINAVRGAALAMAGVAVLYGLYVWTHPHRLVKDVSLFAVIIPAAVLLIMIAAGWLRWPRVWPWVFAALIMAENLTWSGPYARAVLNVWPYYPTTKPLWERTPEDFARPWPRSEPLEASFFQEKSMSLDNRRGTALQWNRQLYELQPVINGYEALPLYGLRQTLCSPWAESRYTREINDYEVTRENQRGNLFLKRSFWLARQYVQGNLPDKETLFPAAVTVFLPQASELPLPRVDAAALPRRGVSDEVQETALTIPEALKGPLQPTKAGEEITVELPTVNIAPLHSTLYLEYTGTAAGCLNTAFVDPLSQRDELGKTTWFSPTQGRRQSLEVPLPDFDRLQMTLTFRFNQPQGAMTITNLAVRSDLADEDRLIRITARTANTAEVEVGPLPGARVLTFVDTAYPGWKAYVDGKRTPLYVANDVFKAVVLPAGTHHVRFVFQPRRVYIGMAVSSVSVAALFAALLLLRRRWNGS